MFYIIDDVTCKLKTLTIHDIINCFYVLLVNFLNVLGLILSFTFCSIGSGTLIIVTTILDKCGRKRIIMDRTDEEPYLERYYLFLTERENFPFNIFIHKFLKSDPDDLHDHPWGFRTVILKGGYWEHTEQGKFWRSPGFTQCVSPSHKHRVELKPNCNCWTLFIPYKREREWGFYRDNKWIESEEYFELRKQEKNKEKNQSNNKIKKKINRIINKEESELGNQQEDEGKKDQ